MSTPGIFPKTARTVAPCNCRAVPLDRRQATIPGRAVAAGVGPTRVGEHARVAHAEVEVGRSSPEYGSAARIAIDHRVEPQPCVYPASRTQVTRRTQQRGRAGRPSAGLVVAGRAVLSLRGDQITGDQLVEPRGQRRPVGPLDPVGRRLVHAVVHDGAAIDAETKQLARGNQSGKRGGRVPGEGGIDGGTL